MTASLDSAGLDIPGHDATRVQAELISRKLRDVFEGEELVDQAAQAIHAARTYLVTGSASGIGKATVEHLRDQGHVVIGADLRNSEIVADLATDAGRQHLVAEAENLSGGGWTV